jgi:hypothetical protein
MKFYSKYTVFCSFLAIAIVSNSQEIKHQGQVLDEITKEPITFANVFCTKNPRKGTMTNENGKFMFWATNDCKVFVSHLGYEPSAVNGSNSTFYLQPTPLQLDEVSIGVTKISGRNLVLRAIERLKENHAVEPAHYDVFNRVVMFDTDSVVHHIIEFSTEIVQNNSLATRYKMKKMRAGAYTEFGKKDLDDYSFMSSKKLDFDNIFKYRDDFLKKRASRKYKYTYEGLMEIDNSKVYKVKYHTDENTFYKTGYLYIDKATFGIVKKTIVSSKNNQVLHEVGFKQIDNKWYQSYAYDHHQGYQTNKINERLTLFTPKFENQSPNNEFDNIRMPSNVTEYTKNLDVDYWDYETFIPLPDWIIKQISD